MATAAQRADNAGDAESAILKLDFAECPRSRFIAASGVDLAETRTNDLFISLSPLSCFFGNLVDVSLKQLPHIGEPQF